MRSFRYRRQSTTKQLVHTTKFGTKHRDLIFIRESPETKLNMIDGYFHGNRVTNSFQFLYNGVDSIHPFACIDFFGTHSNFWYFSLPHFQCRLHCDFVDICTDRGGLICQGQQTIDFVDGIENLFGSWW